MHKPRLTLWQIWNMSFGFLGIQFGWGLQMANISAIYEYLGARPDQIAKLWIAAPLTGLLVQPIIARCDRATGAGHRRGGDAADDDAARNAPGRVVSEIPWPAPISGRLCGLV